MKSNKYREVIENLLTIAGVKIDGPEGFDIQIKNADFYKRVLSQGILGLGEAYMDGWWDAKELDQFICKVLRANLRPKMRADAKTILHYMRSRFANLQTKSKAVKAIHKHYDIGNNLYQKMLGPSMAYTCAYWKDAKNLDEAQYAKFDLICKKVGLAPGMKILELGCGFGTFMKFAAEHYGVTAVGYTISEEQVKLGRELCKGLPVEIKFADYREATEKFDRVVSIGLMEHVGYKNYRQFMELSRNCLKDEGLFLAHTIGNNISMHATDPWINKYIFANSNLPSLKQITTAFEGLFVMEDFHNIGADYDKTLMAWFENFNNNWGSLKPEYDDRFYRMWKYYLLSCAGAFRSRDIQLWQMVFSKQGVPGGYKPVR